MNRCPITYEPCGEKNYSKKGLRLLSPRLQNLQDFPFGKAQQLELALEYADKFSFSGVQRKLNARLVISRESFEVVGKGGSFIIKPQSDNYSELPQNEDVTMKLAAHIGIDTPVHGLMYCNDGSLSYFIKRFDRTGRGEKIAVEDFAQLAGVSREAKYDFTMERLVPLIDNFCTFPVVEKKTLLLLTLFSFLIGNEDLHLKNLSLIRQGETTRLSPAYDLLNSSIVMKASDELALPLHGKKSGFTRAHLVDYFGKERLKLAPQVIQEILDQLQNALPKWRELIQISFLSKEKKQAYLNLLQAREKRLFPL